MYFAHALMCALVCFATEYDDEAVIQNRFENWLDLRFVVETAASAAGWCQVDVLEIFRVSHDGQPLCRTLDEVEV